MKRFLHAIGNVFLTILTLLLIGYGWAFIEIKLLLKSQPDLFGYAFYIQQDEDMITEFTENDVIVVKKGDSYKAGDAILYFDSNDSKYKMRYVVNVNANSTIVKNAFDGEKSEPFSNDNVVGRAIGKVMLMGSLIHFFKQKVVLVLLGVAGVVFLVISQYIEYQPKKESVDAK